MSGSTWGTIFTVTTWGESHGPAIGAVVDGCPAGLALSEADIQPYLDRRRPGQSAYTTQRSEADTVEILSGTYEGVTTGTPISMLIRNTNQHSADYSELAACYRPGHADYGYDAKYGIRDPRGGGRSSGRETAARVCAGAIACKALSTMGICVHAHILSIGGIPYDDEEAVHAYLDRIKAQGDSAGGVIECEATGVPAGIGDPVFAKLDARLSAAIMSIGAVKAVEFGDGTLVSEMLGSEDNDSFYMDGDTVSTRTNHAGGILGGISDGSPIIVRAYVKPTPSIARTQSTVTREGQDTEISIRGRHDPCIALRAAVVVESMTAVTLLDLMLGGMTARLSDVARFYGR